MHVIAPGGTPLDAPRRGRGLVVHRAGGGALFRWPGAAARAREAPWRLLDAAPFALGVALRLREIGRVDRAIAHWIVPSAFPLAVRIDAPLEIVAHGADVRLLLGAPRAVRERVIATLLSRGAHFTFAAAVLLASLEEHVAPAIAARLAAASHVEPPRDRHVPREERSPRRRDPRAELGHRGRKRAPSASSPVRGRLIASKRVELAIDAVAKLGASFRLVVVGDGPERGRLEAHADSRGVVAHFTGALPRREALAYVAAADVLLHPSAVEAAPTVVREARPPASASSPATPATSARLGRRSDNRIVIAPADARAFAQALERAARRRP